MTLRKPLTFFEPQFTNIVFTGSGEDEIRPIYYSAWPVLEQWARPKDGELPEDKLLSLENAQ